MIDSKFKSVSRPGLQGSLKFDNTSSSANPALFKELKSIVQGIEGLGGAGGQRAQKINSGNLYRESQAFMNTKERNAVESRLEKQFTERLTSTYGASAEKAGMSIPDYLQSQGVGGIREVGEGDDRRFSAYERKGFKEVNFNPLMGSNEKFSKAQIKNAGYTFSQSGGMDESKRLNAIVSSAIATDLGERARLTEVGLTSGHVNKGDMEGLSISKGDKTQLKHRLRTLSNVDQVGSYYDQNSPMIERVRSEMLRTQELQKLKTREKVKMQEEGLLDPDPVKDDKSGSGKGVIQKGAAAMLSMTLGTITKIASMIGSMLGYMKKISMDMGRLMKDSAEVGIDVNTADAMRKWGLGNPAFNNGNEFIQLDAVKAFNAKAGDITRVGGVDFDPMAFQGYGGLIQGVVESAVGQNPLEGTKTIYNSMAKTYMNAGSPKEMMLELKKQMAALTAAFGGDFAAGYSSMLRASTSQGLINKGNAGNMWDINMSNNNIDRLKSVGGSHVNELIPGAAGAMDLAGNTKMLNDVLGDLAKIQNALYMMLLSNMDLIVQILLSIAKGVLGIMARFGVAGAKEGLERLTKAEAGMARKGQINLDENVTKAELAAKAEIKGNLRKMGLRDEELDSMTEAAFAGGSKGDLSSVPEQYRKSVTGSVATKLAVYNTGKARSKDIYNDTMYGNFTTSGLLGNMFQDAASEQKNLLSLLGLGEYNPGQGDINSIEQVKLGKEQQNRIKGNAYGIGATGQSPMNDTLYRAIRINSPILSSFIDNDPIFQNNLYPEATMPRIPSGVPGAPDSDLGGLPFFPKEKNKFGWSNFGHLPQIASGAQYTSSGSTQQNFSLHDATVRIELVQKDKVIATNVVTLSDENQRRHISSMRANIADN